MYVKVTAARPEQTVRDRVRAAVTCRSLSLNTGMLTRCCTLKSVAQNQAATGTSVFHKIPLSFFLFKLI